MREQQVGAVLRCLPTPMSATTQARRTEETGETLLDADERERALRALDALLEGDEAEQRETFAFLSF